ncbi:MAG TPA: anthranilate phosphoribosyltransferase [Candidatus Gastranaerophilaceae bacterium]|nr:anthranilate phosphoribosyltransferase [Candidatus Gastranaerophilaceae bacterium]HPT40764.1 anthranilate phosphoribosyltransferase [Candidatus Gastranaerophilaceae bacterium]
MKGIIKKITAKEELSFEEIEQIVVKIANQEVSEAQIGAFLVAITEKGVSKDEFFAFASAMRNFSNRVILDKFVVDSCGTGADFSKSINVSTASAIVASASGANVLKQTNSSITSACGSSDFLKALDINIARIPQDAKAKFEKNGIAFVHSPYFNDFARVNNPIRQQVGIKTIFNYLGPMINPAFPQAQLLGVSSLEMCEKMVYALDKLGTQKALVVNGLNPNIDEISICSKTAVWELNNRAISYYEIAPEDFGFKTTELSEIQGGRGEENAKIIQAIFKGEIKGAKRDIILMNAGAMIYLAGLAKDMFEGAKIAQNVIESGLAQKKLLELQERIPLTHFSNARTSH